MEINKFEWVLRALPKRSDREVVIEHRKILSLQTVKCGDTYIHTMPVVLIFFMTRIQLVSRFLTPTVPTSSPKMREKFTSYSNVTNNTGTNYSARKQMKPCLQIWCSTRFVIALRDSLKDNSVPH